MNIKPGDIFEWVYSSTQKSVRKHERLYTSLLIKWVPCDGLCLCIGINRDTIYWFSKHGVFEVKLFHKSDLRWIDAQIASDTVIPRIRT